LKKIYVLHENSEWVEPLRKAFAELHLPYDEWFINEGMIDLDEQPPEGVFYNRMSASSHTRDHRYAVEFAGPILAWLTAAGRRIINNRRALQLEVRKFEQYLALNSAGIKTPKTIAACGMNELKKAILRIGFDQFILKPNRGGKGAGVQLIQKGEDVVSLFRQSPELQSLDGINLVQEYIKPAETHITRVEFIGGKYYYAVKVDTTEGFELCPADACQVGDAFCPTDENEASVAKAKFEILQDYQNRDIPKYEKFLSDNGMEIAAIEYVVGKDGIRYVYDVNTNTNYNSKAEQAWGGQGAMKKVAAFLGEELQNVLKSTV